MTTHTPNELRNQAPCHISVLGVGGAGINAITHMAQVLDDARFLCMDTDPTRLKSIQDTHITPILLDNLPDGTRSDTAHAHNIAIDHQDTIKSALTGTDMLIIVAGLGGGTSGIIPVVVDIAHKLGIITTVLATLPFTYEGNRRAKVADDVLTQLLPQTCVIALPNIKLSATYPNLSFRDGLTKSDEHLTEVAGALMYMFDVATSSAERHQLLPIITRAGYAMVSVGYANKERATDAVKLALTHPMFTKLHLHHLEWLSLVIRSSHLPMNDIIAINDVIKALGVMNPEDGQLFYEIDEDDTLDDEVAVVMMATGLSTNPADTDSDPVSYHTLKLQQAINAGRALHTRHTHLVLS